MTPAERVLVETALRWSEDTASAADLAQAAQIVKDERTTVPIERPRQWGELVEGDQIQSAKTGKWYAVERTVRLADGYRVRINLEGNGKPVEKPAGETVMARRGETGLAADVFAAVMWSGPAAPAPRKDDAA